MDGAKLAKIESKLDSIVRLLAAPLVEDKPLAETAPRLSTLRLDRTMIASICGSSVNAVGNAIRTSKKKGKASTKGTRKAKKNGHA